MRHSSTPRAKEGPRAYSATSVTMLASPSLTPGSGISKPKGTRFSSRERARAKAASTPLKAICLDLVMANTSSGYSVQSRSAL